MLTRRECLAGLAGVPLALAAGRVARSAKDESLPRVRAITRGPRFHWFGYYDKHQFDASGRYVLGNEVNFEHRSPAATDVIKVGMVDLEDGDRWIELGESQAWNWQQGCMHQWRPGHDDQVVWNDRRQDQFVCHVLDVTSKEKRTIGAPVYCLSPDGRYGLATDFRRLNDCRPGYGYAGPSDPYADVPAPRETGLWRVDLETGEQRLLFSYADVVAIPPATPYEAGAKHWFNHLLISPDGTRFVFLHRWRVQKDGAPRMTRMFTADVEGGHLHVLDASGRTSHFVWRDPNHVIAWTRHPSLGDGFYLFEDQTDKVEPIGRGQMTADGHVSYLPDPSWLVCDTYPDRGRLQHPYLYHIPTARRIPLGHFESPPEYTGEWRCDTHPRISRDGRRVVIDSPHEGQGRQMHLIEIGELLG